MKMIFKMIVTLPFLAFLASWGAFGQQLPQYSQYIFNGLHLNTGMPDIRVSPIFSPPIEASG